jgi:hypothetical protein
MNIENLNMARMTERYCALSVGIIYLALGLAGFVPAWVSLPGTGAPYIPADVAPNAYAAGFGFIFGVIPTNLLHNLVRCAVGFWGIASYNNANSARLFNRVFAVVYAVLAIMGFLPFARSFFGLMPLFGINAWINTLAAIFAGYYGILMPAKIMGVNVSENI